MWKWWSGGRTAGGRPWPGWVSQLLFVSVMVWVCTRGVQDRLIPTRRRGGLRGHEAVRFGLAMIVGCLVFSLISLVVCEKKPRSALIGRVVALLISLVGLSLALCSALR